MRTTTFHFYVLRAIAAGLTVTGGLANLSGPAFAGGDFPMEYVPVLPPVEGRGCYYDRGEERCGTYCYWEVNGKRYCTERLRNAHSQAPVDEVYVGAPRPYRYQSYPYGGMK